MNSPLFLPGDPRFNETLANPDLFNYEALGATKGSMTFIARSDTGLLEPATSEELAEYIYGGEYEERMTRLGEDNFD